MQKNINSISKNNFAYTIFFICACFLVRLLYLNNLGLYSYDQLIRVDRIDSFLGYIDDSFKFEIAFQQGKLLGYFHGGHILDIVYSVLNIDLLKSLNSDFKVIILNLFVGLSIANTAQQLGIPKKYIYLNPYLVYITSCINKELFTIGGLLFLLIFMSRKALGYSIFNYSRIVYDSILMTCLIISILMRPSLFIAFMAIFITIKLILISSFKIKLNPKLKIGKILRSFILIITLVITSLIVIKMPWFANAFELTTSLLTSWSTDRYMSDDYSFSLFTRIIGFVYAPFAPFPLGIVSAINLISVENSLNTFPFLLYMSMTTLYLTFLGAIRLYNFCTLFLRRTINFNRFKDTYTMYSLCLVIIASITGLSGNDFTRQAVTLTLFCLLPLKINDRA